MICIETGGAKNNRVVIVALYSIVKESFQIYYDITEIMGILIDRFMELDIPNCVKVHEIFCRVSKQFDELDVFYDWCKTVGIARSSEYPEVERITQKKLEVMDEFIRDKSALAQSKRGRSEEKNNDAMRELQEPEIIEEDMNAIKALPPPEGFCAEENGQLPEENEKKQDSYGRNNATTLEADLLNLGEIPVTSEEHGDKLALALFDGGGAAKAPPQTQTWEAFPSDDPADWETALVQSASCLSNQKATLGGGFDTLLLDGMYQQANTATVVASGVAHGSASSVAFGSAGQPPTMLALPAPPMASGGGMPLMPGSADPFAASLVVAPPPYVQMSEMEKKQKLLVEEQLMWQQYAKDGMQGQLGMAKLQQVNYNTHSY